MKLNSGPGFGYRLWSWGAVLLSLALVASPLEHPRIVAIVMDDGQAVVTVAVPSGIRKVTLESRPRLGGIGWEPRQVARLEGTGGDVVFRLPASDQVELLRVRGDEYEPLPPGFYEGAGSMGPQPANSGAWWGDYGYGVPGMREGDAGAPPEGREVVESDIWQLRGNTLYFFNQYRGLQVIDVEEPDRPRLTGTLALAAAGEQMYVLPGGELILLAGGGCYYAGNGPESELLIVTVTDGSPGVTARVPVAGQIQESRLVGSALYVAAQTYRAVDGEDGTQWEWGTKLSAFDLSEPASPVARNSLWFPGYHQAVTATERYFLLATQDANDWRRSVVRLIDIEDPAGHQVFLGEVRAAGMIADKFKIHVEGDVLTLISEVRATDLYTMLETFSLLQPATPVKLGELSLGLSERLHATRFSGGLVYIVTFFVQFQMDPLWVVDLSNPTEPRIRGELEIPGWSTYLHPWGDRLVACGIETNQTTVSLFDVGDPDRPALLKRLVLGSGWSWSEANNDEKAFQVLVDEGLILVPYQSWDAGQWVTRVQLIDLSPESLVARGAIEHSVAPRRATLHNDRVISVSGEELLCVDISDRDSPTLTAELDLAWPVDWVIAEGDHLIELNRGASYYAESGRPLIRVALAADPDLVLDAAELPRDWPVLSAEAREGRLFVVQGTTEGGPPTDPVEWTTHLRLTIYDLAHLPSIPVLGETEVVWGEAFWQSEFQMVWPRHGLLVLVAGVSQYWYPWLDWRLDGIAGDVAFPGGLAPYYWGSNGGRFLAFGLDDVNAPELVSEVDLTTEGWSNFSKASVADGLVYLSHMTAEPAPPRILQDETTGEWTTNYPPDWLWVQRSFLDVIDYTDSSEPVVRRPIETTGGLVGVSPGGAVVYTVGARWQPDKDWSNDASEWLDASAYDGISLHRIDSLKLPANWPRPLLVTEDLIVIGRADPAGTGEGVLETWSLGSEGTLTLNQSLKLENAAHTVIEVDGLVAVQNSLEVLCFAPTGVAELRSLGGGMPFGCVWPDLRHAAADPLRALWVPLGYNGVWKIPLGSAF